MAGKIRVLADPSDDLWIENIVGNERLISSFATYMDKMVATYQGMALKALGEGETEKAVRIAGGVDTIKLIRLRVLNEDRERRSKERYREEQTGTGD